MSAGRAAIAYESNSMDSRGAIVGADEVDDDASSLIVSILIDPKQVSTLEEFREEIFRFSKN